MTTIKHYSGAVELAGVWPERRAVVRARFPVGRIKKYDDFSLIVGTQDGKLSPDFLPVTRIISYKENGSKHKCGAKCRGAKGGNCECECGGANHGRDYTP
jgi:hypothetical protein